MLFYLLLFNELLTSSQYVNLTGLIIWKFMCLQRLPDQIKDRNEKMKEEMIGELLI